MSWSVEAESAARTLKQGRTSASRGVSPTLGWRFAVGRWRELLPRTDRRFGSGALRTLRRVVVHVPAGALELKARARSAGAQHAWHLGHSDLRLGTRSSGFFQIDGRTGCSDTDTAARRFNPPAKNHALSLLYREGGNSLQYVPPCRNSLRLARKLNAPRWEPTPHGSPMPA